MDCIIIDDSEIIRKQMSSFIQKTGFLNCCGEFSCPSEIDSCLETNNISLIFLDIEMPGMSGFDFLEKFDRDIQIIVISVSRKYALEAFNYDITDYLLKPITYERFMSAVTRAVEKHVAANKKGSDLYFKSNGSFIRVPQNDIVYGKVCNDMFEITTDSFSLMVGSVTADSLLSCGCKFAMVNDCHLVNISKIHSVSDDGHINFKEGFCAAEEIIVDEKHLADLKNLI